VARLTDTDHLLVPAEGDQVGIAPVAEVQAWAQSLPYLRYPLGEAQPGALLGRAGVAQVRVPSPGRFAVHKMIVAQLRTSRSAETDRDLEQAAVVAAALAAHHPGGLEEALSHVPASAMRYVRASLPRVEALLTPAHPHAVAALAGAAPSEWTP
jgi:hypothetical protein